MKRLFIITLLISAIFLFGCNSSTPTDTPQNPEGSATTEQSQQNKKIILDNYQLELSVGKIAKLNASVEGVEGKVPGITFKSDHPDVVYIDQNGNVSAVGQGSATITAEAPDFSPATCKITVSERKDSFDRLLFKYGKEVAWNEYYAEGLRLDENGEIVFSPIITEFNWNEGTGDTSIYQIYLRFTHISSKDIPAEFTFSSQIYDINMSDYRHMNIVLNGAEGGFCPISEESYKIEYAIIHKFKKSVIYYGCFDQVDAPKSIASSPNYKPTPMPGFMPKDENQFYLNYTASEGGIIDGAMQQVLYLDQTGTTVTAKAQKGYKFIMWNDGVKTPERNDIMGEADTKFTAYFVKEASGDMPVANMYIFTSTGEPVLTKEYIDAQMLIVGAKDPAFDISASLKIKGRGNSSWSSSAPQEGYNSKNSYRLKLNDKEQLLGIGDSKNKDWILNSNKFDLSGLRNYLVWNLAERMDSLPYVTECQWVQLYVNSQYRGMYMLTERIEVANDRVEVDDTIESTDKGYLIEIDFRGTEEKQPFFYVTGYGAASNGNEREFVIKSNCTEQDRQFIAEYVRRCHDAIVSGNRAAMDELIDIDSFIDMYIIEELSKDVDVGAASFFMQKAPGGKIYFTAPWDFDFGFGTYDKAVSFDGMISIGKNGCTWYSALIEHEWFRKEVLDRMAELDDDFDATMKAVRNKAEEIKPAADQNAVFWNMYGNKYHGYVSSDVSSNLYSYEEHIDFLVNWSNSRWAIMKDFLSTYTGYDNYFPEIPELPNE